MEIAFAIVATTLFWGCALYAFVAHVERKTVTSDSKLTTAQKLSLAKRSLSQISRIDTLFGAHKIAKKALQGIDE